MTKHSHSLEKSRPSRKAQGNFSVSFLAQSPAQRERNLRGVELARQALKDSEDSLKGKKMRQKSGITKPDLPAGAPLAHSARGQR